MNILTDIMVPYLHLCGPLPTLPHHMAFFLLRQVHQR